MIRVSAQVIETHGDSSVVALKRSGCTSCHNPCATGSRVVLPAPLSGGLLLSMSQPDQIVCTLHSLLLPLAGFVVGAVLFDRWFASDLLALLGAMTGLGIAARLCKVQTMARLKIQQEALTE